MLNRPHAIRPSVHPDVRSLEPPNTLRLTLLACTCCLSISACARSERCFWRAGCCPPTLHTYVH
eukprot:12213455-Alexandrium_andersonii.AAC.1